MSHSGLLTIGLPPVQLRVEEDMKWTAPPDRSAVIAAGQVLRAIIPPDEVAIAAEHFRVAHDWRAAHLLPLQGMRLSLHQHARAVDPRAIVAGRIKRMSSIRKKLSRSRINLWDIQDIAGVRAVMPNIEAVNEVVGRFVDGKSRHRVARCQDYIGQPKSSGYRSQHLMMRFQGDDPAFANRSVEIQVRTLHQHAWATALEAVGLMRGEDLKGGSGADDWLRFFTLMSAEIAEAEGQPLPPSAPTDPTARLAEVIDLQRRLNAIETLTGYNHAIQRVNALGRSSGGRFVIRFDRKNVKVTVVPLHNVAGTMAGLRAVEGQDVDAVVVEVDGIDSLAEAYPNYFMDVGLFTDQIRRTLTRERSGKPYLAWLQHWKWRRD